MKNICFFFLLFLVANLRADSFDTDSLQVVMDQSSGEEKLEAQYLLLDEYLSTKKESEALVVFETLKSLNSNPGSIESVYSELMQGRFFLFKNNLNDANQSFLNALKKAKLIGNEAIIAECYKQLARCHYEAAEWDNAIEYNEKALSIFSVQNNWGELAEVNEQLGDLYVQKKIIGKAQRFYDASIQLLLKLTDTKGAGRISLRLGDLYRSLGDYETSEMHLENGLKLYQRGNDSTGIALCLSSLTRTLIELEVFDEAIEINTEAKQNWERLQDRFYLAKVDADFAEIYSVLGDNRKANSYALSSNKQLSKLGVKEGIPELYAQNAEVFELIGNEKAALNTHKQFAKSQKSLLSFEKNASLQQLKTRFDSEFKSQEQEQQIALLQVQKKSDGQIRNFLIGLLILGILFLGFAILAYLKKKKDNQILHAQKKQIENQNQELDEKNVALDLLNQNYLNEIAEREALEKTSFERNQFLATMTHRMGTNLNAIVNLTHLLLNENARPDQKEHLKTLQYSANNLVVFINDVLDFSKIEAGKLSLDAMEFEPTSIYNNIREQFEMEGKSKGLTLQFSYDNKIPKRLWGDASRLNQILTNVLNLSLKQTNKGGVAVHFVLQEDKENEVILAIGVADSGNPIPESQIDQSNVENEEGILERANTTAFALQIARRLTELQNGKFTITTNQLDGNSFSILLPFKKVLQSSLQRDSSKESQFNRLRNHSILLVEDNKINQTVVAKILRNLGLKVTTANNGLEALDEVASNDFDLILMDIQMPEMDGYRATAEIRKLADPKKSKTPIIALTASAFLTQKEKANLFGMTDHVGKPFSPEELVDKIDVYLAN